MLKRILTFLFIIAMMLSIVFISSCNKDREPSNNGIFTIEPVEEEEEPTPEPPNSLKSWSLRVNNQLVTADTALITYSFENNLHVFRCNTEGSDVFTIFLASLDSSLYTVDLDHNKIEYKQNGITYNGANSPQGIIHLYKNQDNKISANFSARLFNLSTGQERMITDGKMRNIPYTN